MFGSSKSYMLKLTRRQLQVCILISGAETAHADGTQEPLQEIAMQKLPLPCIIWEADGSFMTVELTGVTNTDKKCVLARKMCSKIKGPA